MVLVRKGKGSRRKYQNTSAAHTTGMKLFCAQVASVWDDPDATLEKVEPCIARASREGGDLICFPEQFATGWDPESTLHVQGIEGPIVRRLQSLAEEYSIAILGSFREATATLPRNTCTVVTADGAISTTYSKCHLFSPAYEDRMYRRGDTISTFSLGGMDFGLAICYDLRFTSLFRLYADAGVQAVLVPSAWPESRLQHWELFIRARAVEYQCLHRRDQPYGHYPCRLLCGRFHGG